MLRYIACDVAVALEDGPLADRWEAYILEVDGDYQIHLRLRGYPNSTAVVITQAVSQEQRNGKAIDG